MRRERAGEVARRAVADGLALHRPAHGDGVPEEVREENAHGKDEVGRVGRHHARLRRRMALDERRVHDAVHERREPHHEKARAGREDKSLARRRGVLRRARGVAGLRLEREGVAEDGDDDQREAAPEEQRIALAVLQVVEERAADERQPHADRERDGHPGDGDRRREEDVRQVEENTGRERIQPGLAEARLQVRQESPFGVRAARAHRQAHAEGEEEDADDVVPVEELVAPGLAGELLGVAPGAPAEHGHDTEDDGENVVRTVVHGRLPFLRFCPLF